MRALPLLLALSLAGPVLAQDEPSPEPAPPTPEAPSEPTPTPPEAPAEPTPPAPEAPAEPSPPAPPKPAKPAKPTVALVPFRFAPETLRRVAGHTQLLMQRFSMTALNNKLLTRLVQAKRFTLLEREQVAAIERELGLADQGLADATKALEPGQVRTARYLVTGEISAFDLSLQRDRVPHTAQTREVLKAFVVVDLRVISTRTSEILGASAVKVRWRKPAPATRDSLPTELVDDLQRDLCDRLYVKTLDVLAPARIVQVEGQRAYLDRGRGEGFAVGDVLEVVTEGKEIRSPEGELLGTTHSVVAKVKVVSLQARLATLEVLSGQAKVGARCRPAGRKESDPRKRGPKGWR